MYLFLSNSISKSKEWLKPTSASTLRRMIDWDIQEELSALFVTNSPLFPCFLFIYTVRLKSAASVDTCQRYITLILSLGMCNLQWRPHTLPGLLGDGRGHAGRWITNIAEDLSSIRAAVFFLPSWNSFSLAAPDSAATLAWAAANSLFVPKAQLSLLELFKRFLVKAVAASVSSKQLPSSVEVAERSMSGAMQGNHQHLD